MVKATFLIPRLDNDGTKLNTPIEILEADLCNVFGGFTRSRAAGDWKDEHAFHYRDELLCYFVTTERENLQQLKDLLLDFKSRTKQNCLYLDVADVVLEWI